MGVVAMAAERIGGAVKMGWRVRRVADLANGPPSSPTTSVLLRPEQAAFEVFRAKRLATSKTTPVSTFPAHVADARGCLCDRLPEPR